VYKNTNFALEMNSSASPSANMFSRLSADLHHMLIPM